MTNALHDPLMRESAGTRFISWSDHAPNCMSKRLILHAIKLTGSTSSPLSGNASSVVRGYKNFTGADWKKTSLSGQLASPIFIIMLSGP